MWRHGVASWCGCFVVVVLVVYFVSLHKVEFVLVVTARVYGMVKHGSRLTIFHLSWDMGKSLFARSRALYVQRQTTFSMELFSAVRMTYMIRRLPWFTPQSTYNNPANSTTFHAPHSRATQSATSIYYH